MDLQINYETRKQEQTDLLKELDARVFTHKVAIVGGAFMRKYMKHQKTMGGAMLPETIIKEQAQEYSQQTLQHALLTGSLDGLYDNIWEEIRYLLPDDMNVMNACEEI